MNTGPIRVTWTDNNYSLLFEGPGAEQLGVMIEAVQVYTERNKKYNDNWRRMGSRGMIFRIRERAERIWDNLWDYQPDEVESVDYRTGDVIDSINFAGFLVRALRERNRDGSWWGDSRPAAPVEESIEELAKRMYTTFRNRVRNPVGNKFGTWDQITEEYRSGWLQAAHESRGKPL